MFIVEALIALGQHLIRNARAFSDRTSGRSIPCSTRVQADGHHPCEVSIPSQVAPTIVHTIVSPEAVKVTAEAAAAYAWICEPAGMTAPASSGLT